jgi:hypothetical protein
MVVGNNYGLLTAIRATTEKHNGKHTVWEYDCECGGVVLRAATLVNKSINSGKLPMCPACAKKRCGDRFRTHGHTKNNLALHPEFNSWVGAKKRCMGGCHHKGKYKEHKITMSDEWFDSYETFYKDMGPRPSPKHSLDRVDTFGPYSKENCRWATSKDQANNRCNNRDLETKDDILKLTEPHVRYLVDGRIRTVREWMNYINTRSRKTAYLWIVHHDGKLV